MARGLLTPASRTSGRILFSLHEAKLYIAYKTGRKYTGDLKRLSRSAQRSCAIRLGPAKTARLFQVEEAFLTRLLANWRGR